MQRYAVSHSRDATVEVRESDTHCLNVKVGYFQWVDKPIVDG